MPMSAEISSLVEKLAGLLLARNLTVTTAESCTGGGIAAAMTDVPGSSRWFEYGFVTYSNGAKTRLIDVSNDTLDQYGAVSSQVVEEMALGALAVSGADIAVAVSGVAGPDGATPQKPVGTVWFCWQVKGQKPMSQCSTFSGNRLEIRHAAVIAAVSGLIPLLEEQFG
ncbi:MAG: CinA family protein [bacterium]